MHEAVAILLRHGYLVLFLWVLLEQLGLPVPSFPMLLAAGALAGSGRLGLHAALLIATLAALISDSLWFSFGRARGNAVLRWICKISLEPDSCVRRTEDIYSRNGAKSLLVAKLIPGLGAVAAPLAGVSGMPLYKFALFDVMGILIWTGGYIGLGFVFTDQLEDVARYALHLGEFLGLLIVSLIAGYLCYKYLQRRKLMCELRVARISPQELKETIEAGTRVQIVDLRHSLDVDADPVMLPGAVHFAPSDIDQLILKIAADQEIILYCT